MRISAKCPWNNCEIQTLACSCPKFRKYTQIRLCIVYMVLSRPNGLCVINKLPVELMRILLTMLINFNDELWCCMMMHAKNHLGGYDKLTIFEEMFVKTIFDRFKT